LDGSVTDAKVAAGAGILQSKLNLNGVIPPAWLGTTSSRAARGSDAEYKSNKGVVNGYCPLDGNTPPKIPTQYFPTLAGTGTVTSVALALPTHFTISGSPVTSSGTLTAAWAQAPPNSWFGNNTGSNAVPGFKVAALPTGLIPNLDASKITTGTLGPARLPVAVYGTGSAIGAVPNPGISAPPDDYLARDMTYKTIPVPAKVVLITSVALATYTPPAGVRALLVELWGPGGGGGGAQSSAGNLAAGAGGGGGGYASKFYATVAASYSVQAGTGGVPGVGVGGGGGGAGGPATTFGGVTANGGGGGNGDPAGGSTEGVDRTGGVGGVATGGDINMVGSDGGSSIRWSGTVGISGAGAGSAMGGGAVKGVAGPNPGNDGNLYGGGGSGGLSTTTGGSAGGRGANGVIRITEYY
jgi:hypothetical protein